MRHDGAASLVLGELLIPIGTNYVVCCNILGSCYSSIELSRLCPGYDNENSGNDNIGGGINGADGLPRSVLRNRLNQAIYRMDFLDVSVCDRVLQLQLLLLNNKLRIG